MSQDNLRQLAKKFADSDIDKDDYRKSRATLLDGIIAGDIEVQVNEFPDLIVPSEDDAMDITEQRGDRQNSDSPSQPTAKKPAARPPSNATPMWVFYAGGAGVVIIIIALLMFLLPGETDQDTIEIEVASNPAATTTSPVTEPAVIKSEQALQVINAFIQTDRWDVVTINRAVSDWEALSIDDRLSVKDSTEMGRLAIALSRQFEEEKSIMALSGNNSANDTNKLEVLINLANTLGLDNSRLTLPEPAIVDTVAETPDITVAVNPETLASEQKILSAANDITSEIVSEAESAVEIVTDTISESETVAEAEVISEDLAVEDATDVNVSDVESQESDSSASQAPPVVAVESPTSTPVQQTEQSRTRSGACNATLVNSRRPYCQDDLGDGEKAPYMVVMKGGDYTMGGTQTSESPQRNVSIPNAFAMSVHEVTYGEYQLFCQDNCPEQPWAGKDYPIVNISWNDAVAYTEWLSEKTGQSYRLPTEAEWEFAARAGTDTEYPSGEKIDLSFAVYSERRTLSSPLPKTDRTINRNAFRLYHMLGNVREWVLDSWSDNFQGAPTDGSAVESNSNSRVIRGGAYNDNAKALRSAARTSLNAESSDNYTGFRVIQNL